MFWFRALPYQFWFRAFFLALGRYIAPQCCLQHSCFWGCHRHSFELASIASFRGFDVFSFPFFLETQGVNPLAAEPKSGEFLPERDQRAWIILEDSRLCHFWRRFRVAISVSMWRIWCSFVRSRFLLLWVFGRCQTLIDLVLRPLSRVSIPTFRVR